MIEALNSMFSTPIVAKALIVLALGVFSGILVKVLSDPDFKTMPTAARIVLASLVASGALIYLTVLLFVCFSIGYLLS